MADPLRVRGRGSTNGTFRAVALLTNYTHEGVSLRVVLCGIRARLGSYIRDVKVTQCREVKNSVLSTAIKFDAASIIVDSKFTRCVEKCRPYRTVARTYTTTM